MEIFLIIVVALVVVGVIVGHHIIERQRRDAMAGLAAKLGLRFRPDKDRGLADQLSFLDKLDDGSNRYGYNCMDGSHQGHEVTIFDYHYETYSYGGKGGRKTHHHHLTVLLLVLPRSFPELIITPEGFFSKIAQAIGYEDIDFESAEFSRAFCVRSRDKKFAYDVCHGLMMEYLLANRDLSIEIDGNVQALVFASRAAVPEIEHRLRQLVEIRQLLPEYLFTKS